MPVVSDYTALLSDSYWTSGDGVPTVITYSYSTSAQQSVIDNESAAFVNSFSAFSAQQETMTNTALGLWAAASGIIFVEVAAGTGDMEFGNFDLDLDPQGAGAAGYAYYPGRYLTDTYASQSAIGGDVFIDAGQMGNASDLYLIMHEIGHALGLEHPFEGTNTLDPLVDNGDYTVMSYNPTVGSRSALGTFDEEAMAVIYGGPAWTPSTTGGLTVFTWDATEQTLTQTWGYADSDIMGSSFRDTISAGAGADLIGGYGGGDRINAGDGADIVWGGGGYDRIFGDAGNDDLNGEGGNDVIYGGDGDDDLNGSAGSDDMYGGLGVDSFFGGAGYDEIAGGAGADFIYAGSGNDSLYGGADNDWLQGVAGSDIIEGGGGNDTVFGGNGNDHIIGEGGADYVDGGLGVDFIFGGEGGDNLRGNAGGDTIEGGGAADVIQGQGGNDILMGDDGGDSVYGGGGQDYLEGGNGDDRVYGGTSRDDVFGGGGNDRVYGDDANDNLFGGSGNDRMYGGNGNDQITGGAGDDTMYGDAGDDVFVFSGAFGDDWIYDFTAGDRIDLSGTAINSFAQWQAATTQPFSNAVETTIGNNTISVFNVVLADFDASDFIF